jgi:hypothetical protein
VTEIVEYSMVLNHFFNVFGRAGDAVARIDEIDAALSEMNAHPQKPSKRNQHLKDANVDLAARQREVESNLSSQIRSINHQLSELRDQNSDVMAIASCRKEQRPKEQTENDLQTEINRFAS